MKGKLLLGLGIASLAMGAQAQRLQESYIQWPNSSELHNYINTWVPGQEMFEDENFFVSRVKPKEYFRNAATQVNPDLNAEKDKNLVFWVPVNYASWEGVHTDGLPNGRFDSEVFSMWQYVTHYGDWISPFGWVPGSFADAAHKHGTAVSGVASIPYGGISSSWSTCLTALGNVDHEKAARFLYYHGCNGLGYNSEFNGGSGIVTKLNALHEDLVKWMKGKVPVFENIWYGGTSDNGSINFDDQLSSGKMQIFGNAAAPRTVLFLNYNWNYDSKYNNSLTNCTSAGRSMHDLYAGMNMQGSCKTATEWQRHLTWDYSIGLWGAHQTNQLWQNRNGNGSSPDALQSTYQRSIEMFFGNGPRNPIAWLDVPATPSLTPKPDYFGMSRFMTARSAMGWNLADEPFISYFNLGNGKFFNYKGERMHNSEWYNIGVQDYMPTWRFWFADQFLGNKPANIPASGLDAAFSWNEAWFGGSSLRITGSTPDEFLHIFKTNFQLANNDVITVRYKLASGKANINLALSLNGKESEIVRESNFKVLTTDTEADEDVWQVATFKVAGVLGSALRSAPVAMIALHFTEAENIDLYLGEISIVRGTAATPKAPVITHSKTLAFNHNGVDGKIIWNMENNKLAGDPVYNTDVNTSMFRLYSQQEGGEAVNMGATTSWAGLIFAAPVDVQGAKKIRFGVSAVALDHTSESEIAWTDYMDMGDYATSEDIQINKSTIKPGEQFVISYVDPLHAASNWQLNDLSGNKVAEATGTQAFTASVEKVGSYDLVIDGGTANERVINSYVQVSSWEKGAIPEITALTINDEENPASISVKKADEVTLGYKGRESDGVSSRAVALNELLLGASNSATNLDIKAYQPYAVGAWIKLDRLNTGTYSLMTIENRAGNWPKNNWGHFWLRINQDGYITNPLHDSGFGGSTDSGADGNRLYCDYSDSRIIPEAWTHICVVIDYDSSNRRSYALYINGVKQNIKTWLHINKGTREGKISPDWTDFSMTSSAIAYGINETQTGYVSDSYPISTSDWISFGGTCQNINAPNAFIDDVTIWNKTVTQADVDAMVAGLDGNNLPEGVLAYWDFETDTDENHMFAAKGSKAGAKLCRYAHDTDPNNEGQAINRAVAADYAPGCPFISGTGFELKAQPSWRAKGAVLADAQGSDTEGSVKVTYNAVGERTATVTLSNSLGSDSREYPVITVGEGNALEGLATEAGVEVYAVDKSIFMAFAEAGNYTVNVYTVSGELLHSRSLQMGAGEAAYVGMPNAAVYIVNITRDGRTVNNYKVVVR